MGMSPVAQGLGVSVSLFAMLIAQIKTILPKEYSMSATAKSNNDPDHTLNTLTDMVSIIGETRSDVKVLDRKMDQLEQKVDVYQQENHKRFDQIDQRFGEQDKRFDKIEEALILILNRLS